MEKMAQLIQLITKQHASNEAPAKLLYTAQQIVTELTKQTQELYKPVAVKSISVLMPQSLPLSYWDTAISHAEVSTPPLQEEVVSKKEPMVVSQAIPQPTEYEKKYMPDIPVMVEDRILITSNNKKNIELNELMAASGKKTINDVLATKPQNVGNQLAGEPVKDLRRAIGINDRATFVSELFSSDESFYERSIKTINAFEILAEAEYWIERELKVKQGWNERSPTTIQFIQLVKRRFS
jgi:hypothetical protein